MTKNTILKRLFIIGLIYLFISISLLIKYSFFSTPLITIPNTEFAHGSIGVNGNIYLLTDSSPSKIIKINSNNLADFQVKTLNQNYGKELAYINKTDSLYGIFGGENMCVVKINPETLNSKQLWCYPTHKADNNPSMTTDGTYLYTITTTKPAIIHAINPENSKTMLSLSLPDILNAGHSIRYDNGFLYATGESKNGWVAKISTSDFKLNNFKLFDQDVKFPTDDFAITNNSIFVGFENKNGIIYEIDKNTLKSKKIYSGIPFPIYSVVSDGNNIWVAFDSTPGKLLEISTADNSHHEYSLPLNNPNEIVPMNGNIFVTSWNEPLEVFRVK